jgi:hypothetical protein
MKRSVDSVKWGNLNPEETMKNFAKIKTLFPTLKKEFYLYLLDALVDNDFTDEELVRATNHVIDTCFYPPVIGNFIGTKIKSANKYFGLSLNDFPIFDGRTSEN